MAKLKPIGAAAIALSLSLSGRAAEQKKAIAINTAEKSDWKITAVVELKGDLRFQNTKVGGLSGAVCDEGGIDAISDDRGKFGPQRMYRFSHSKNLANLQLKEMIAIKSPAKQDLDLEGLAWDSQSKNYFVSSEGDADGKPRVPPSLFVVDAKGNKILSLPIPEKFIPNPIGEQTTGVRPNRGFESMASLGDMAMTLTEMPLMSANSKDSEKTPRVAGIRYKRVNSGWSVDQEFSWPLHNMQNQGTELFRGVSEVFISSQSEALVLERSVVGMNGRVPEFNIEIFSTDILFQNKERLSFHLSRQFEFENATYTVPNFEAMCGWREAAPNGAEHLLLISDNDLRSSAKTMFLELQRVRNITDKKGQ